MSLFPKEHGAYGQIAFPLIAAFGVAGLSPGGVLVALAVVAGFLAHEPALVVLGLRGPRAKHELGDRATWWLVTCLCAAVIAGVGAFVMMNTGARWSLAVPLMPTMLLTALAARGREKSWPAEIAAALAFAGAAVPIALAAGLSLSNAAAVAIPFALLFVSSTLAVRVVILRVRRGGDAGAATATRRAALAVVAVSGALLVLATARGLLPSSIVAASAPGLIVAALVAIRPPAAMHLRALGWTLVAVSVLTLAIVVAKT